MVARQIKPRPTPSPSGYSENLATDEDKKKSDNLVNKTALNILGIVVCVLLWIAYPNFLVFWLKTHEPPDRSLAWLGLLGSPFIAYLVTIISRDFVYRSHLKTVVTERLYAENRMAQGQEIAEVAATVVKVEKIYGAQENNLMTLDNLLERTEVSLDRAQRLFNERACTPFWDSIEDAVESLRQFDKQVSFINESAKVYYSQLANRDHTFPAFPVKSGDLPKPEALMKRLTEYIDLAHRTDRFDIIFEQRRTTSAIVTGFRNTHEAITSLRNDLLSSLSDLQSSLESGLENISSNIRDGFDDMAKSHRQSAAELRETLDRHANEASGRDGKHQKFTEEALDNIQNRRKPRFSETKEPFRPSDD